MGITIARIVAESGIHKNVAPKKPVSGIELALMGLGHEIRQNGISRKHTLLEGRELAGQKVRGSASSVTSK